MDLDPLGTSSWWTTSFRLSQSWTSEGHVTSGVSFSIGGCIFACIMLATKAAVASGSRAHGVPWYSRPSWSIHLNLPSSSPGHTHLQGSKSFGARPLTTIPSCMILVVPLGQMSMSRRYPTEPRSSRDFAWALSWDFHIPTSCPNNGCCQSRSRTFSLIMWPANLHAYDHHSRSRCACFSIRRTVMPTICPTMPLEEGWCAGEKDRMMLMFRSLSFWLLSSPPPSTPNSRTGDLM